MENSITEFDELEIYCRKLGHHLNFKYCRTENFNQPCFKIIDCWSEKINVLNFIKLYYNDFFNADLSKNDKVISIYNLIQKAEKTIKI